MKLRIPAKVLIHVWSYDFYDMTLSTGKQRGHMINEYYYVLPIPVPLDQSCAIPGQQCSTVYSVCDSITKICVCTTGYYRLLIPGTTSPQCRQSKLLSREKMFVK